jgi:hypothetical protein
MRRALALWLLLFGVYAATLKLDDYSGDEPHYLLAVESLAHDGDVDVSNEYATRAYDKFDVDGLRPHGKLTKGRLNEPYGIGFPLLILPAYALAGTTGVELFLAALGALALMLAYRLALRAAPDPWALGATAAVGLSAPLLAYSTAVYPELAVGAVLAGAALLALRLDERPGRRRAFGCFALLATLPWLGVRFLPAGAVIGVVAARAIWRSRRRTLAIGSVELALFSVALVVGIHEALYDGPTPYSAYRGGEDPLGSSSAVDRVYRLPGLFVDPHYGLLRWAPVFLLAFLGAWWLWRSRRDRLARAVPLLHGVELTAGLCAAVVAVQLVVAALVAPTADGNWFPGRHLIPVLALATPLVALGLRRMPRVGIALALLSVGIAVWVYVDARWGGGALATVASHQPLIRPTNRAGLSA